MQLYEVTFIDAGVTEYWSLRQCKDYFGKDEFVEYLNGYLPHVVVVKL